jgi:predicted DNA-binding transcriptional regulator AlpA
MDLIDIKECCRRAGGSRPVAACTIYRMIQRKEWPKPVRISGSSRWIKAEVEAAIASMMEARRHG